MNACANLRQLAVPRNAAFKRGETLSPQGLWHALTSLPVKPNCSPKDKSVNIVRVNLDIPAAMLGVFKYIILWILFLARERPAQSTDKYAFLRNVRCENSTVLPTPTYGISNAAFTACTEQLINASIQRVYHVIIDFPTYHLWNSFVINVSLPENPGVKGPSDIEVGLNMVFTTQGLIPDADTTSHEVVTVLRPERGGYGLSAWRADNTFSGTPFTAEHPNVLTDVDGGWTRYVSWETYYDPSAELIRPLQANLQRQFDRQGKDLRRYVEAGRM